MKSRQSDGFVSGLRRPVWNEIPPTPFPKGGDMAASYSPFTKGLGGF